MSDIPIFESLDFYSYPDSQLERYQNLVTSFSAKFGDVPDFISRSPGRVNIIGDHIDYCNFPVLPAALEVDVIFAVKEVEGGSTIDLSNMDPSFKPSTIEIPQDGSFVTVDQTSPGWTDYFKCGMIVSQKFLQEIGVEKPVKGLQIIVDGTVPTGGGLSSSAALICCTALAFLKVNCPDESKLTKDLLTRLCVVSERYVGVNTGGMDQTASICGIKNHALIIKFKPTITAEPVAFPKTEEPFEFVITNSLVVSNKVLTAPKNYNLRVVEVNTCAEILARKYGVSIPQDSGFETGTLRGFMDCYFKDDELTIAKLKELLKIVEETFGTKKEYTVEEAAEELGVTAEEYTRRFLTKNKVIFDKLKLYKRAKHVYSESLRVLEAIKVAHTTQGEEFLQKFGSLMNQSQESSHYACENSCPEVDEICEIALANGSLGSRVTGAGWGGCAVHLVPASKVEKVQSALVENYYHKKFPHITEQELNDAIIVSRPAWGSSLLEGNFNQYLI